MITELQNSDAQKTSRLGFH